VKIRKLCKKNKEKEMATIGNADIEIINELLKERGMKPTYIRVDKLKLIEAVNCDLVITGLSPMVDETTPISEIKKIPKPEFAIRCRENELDSDTILKLVEERITNLERLKYISRETLEAAGIVSSQRDIIINKLLKKENTNPTINQIKFVTPNQPCCKKVLMKTWNDNDIDFIGWIENIEHKLRYSQIEKSKWVIEIMNLLEGRARIVGIKIFNDNSNIEYDEFKEAIIKEMNSKGIKQKAKSELKKLKFKIDSDVIKFVTTAHKYLRIANPQWDEEAIASGIVDILPDHIGSELAITCQNTDISSIIFGLECIQKRMESRRQFSSRNFNRSFIKTQTQGQTSDSGTDTNGDIKKEKLQNFKCSKCGQKGHLSRDCKKPKKETEQKHMANLLGIEEVNLSEMNEIILDFNDSEEVNIDCNELFDNNIIYCDTIIVANKEAKSEPQVPILPTEFKDEDEQVMVKI